MNKKQPAFVSLEIIISLFLSILLIVPLGIWISRETKLMNRTTLQDSVYLDVAYLLADITAAWVQFVPDPLTTKPTPGNTESSISFKMTDGRVIRYYKKGKEIGKDMNECAYENITQQVVQTFHVTNYSDLPGTISLEIYIEDCLGRIYSKYLTKELP